MNDLSYMIYDSYETGDLVLPELDEEIDVGIHVVPASEVVLDALRRVEVGDEHRGVDDLT